jgi:hypothetical protein
MTIDPSGQVALEQAAHLIAVHARHHDVEDDHVGAAVDRFLDCVDPVARGDDLPALALENQAVETQDIGLIVDDENQGRFGHRRCLLWLQTRR